MFSKVVVDLTMRRVMTVDLSCRWVPWKFLTRTLLVAAEGIDRLEPFSPSRRLDLLST